MIFSLVCFKLYCSANFFFLGAPRRQSAAATSRTTQREVNNFFAHAYGLCVPFMIFTFLRFNLYCSANFSFVGAPRRQSAAATSRTTLTDNNFFYRTRLCAVLTFIAFTLFVLNLFVCANQTFWDYAAQKMKGKQSNKG